MIQAVLHERAPIGEPLTDYDREQAVLYLRLLDAEAAGARWQDVATHLFNFDPADEPDRAERMYVTHLARAKWLRDNGYKDLVSGATG
jgi:hypothetical protein